MTNPAMQQSEFQQLIERYADVLGRIRYQNYTGVDGIDRIGTDILASQIKVIDDPSQMSYEM